MRTDLNETIRARQGYECLIPGCHERWSEKAHIWGRRMGGVPSLRDNPDLVVGLCRSCHDIFDGRSMHGRQRMLRLLMESRRDLVELRQGVLDG